MKIMVYPFRAYDHRSGNNLVVSRLSTPEFIGKAKGELISEHGRDVDEKLIDDDGRVLIDPHSESARLLKELSDRGGDASITGNKNRRPLEILIERRLVTYKLPSADAVDYSITDLGRLMVSEVLS